MPAVAPIVVRITCPTCGGQGRCGHCGGAGFLAGKLDPASRAALEIRLGRVTARRVDHRNQVEERRFEQDFEEALSAVLDYDRVHAVTPIHQITSVRH